MTDQSSARDLPGYKVEAVEAWVKANVDGFAPPFKWVQLEGGHSNLTYKITDQKGRVAVIRRPPEGELLPKAHDMSREWSIISGLAPAGIPVAEPIAFCESSDVTGAWFYIMGWVEGVTLFSSDHVEAHIPEENRKYVAYSLVDSVAALHAIDPDDVGLGNLGKKTDYITRQIRAWYGSWTSSIEAGDHDDKRAHEIRDYLADNIPDQGPARVAHGDCALHNVLIGSDYKVAAILDWEVATLGDPLADIAYTLNTFFDPGTSIATTAGSATSAKGFPTRGELAERYAAKTGADLSKLDYFLGFNQWKGACILHGVRARYMAGQKSAEGVDLDEMKQRIEGSLEAAVVSIERYKQSQ